ncbi:unnamed protein product [Ranitomeya imitator]|uniref:3-oxo-5-alpha-steroid 4-dehydrogenase C-terminal domain-containing protein n=1 Tax=Ranitomeya imitator TaxID=111125 RepID=A0ABN9KUP1_9NEOB|nr:unnamed protein product [Ranitomeya imitator]
MSEAVDCDRWGRTVPKDVYPHPVLCDVFVRVVVTVPEEPQMHFSAKEDLALAASASARATAASSANDDLLELARDLVLRMVLFICGMVVNIHSDYILRNLREPGETGYKIPRGGLFEYVSGANFFGEIVEWSGFAIAGWSIPGAAFAVFTFLVLLSRAQQHHQWYIEKFEDYPKSRKIVIPFTY